MGVFLYKLVLAVLAFVSPDTKFTLSVPSPICHEIYSTLGKKTPNPKQKSGYKVTGKAYWISIQKEVLCMSKKILETQAEKVF